MLMRCHSIRILCAVIVAIALIARPMQVRSAEWQAGPRDDRIQFAGQPWHVKHSSGVPVGPGPNVFNAGNVQVIDGRLHLRIARGPSGWESAELVSETSFGYGTYNFVVAGNAASLDVNAVLGLFTWSDDPAYGHREIDVELSRWGDPANQNAQCVVQPYDKPGHIARFAVPGGQHRMHYQFRWSRDEVTCAVTILPDHGDKTAEPVYHTTLTDGVPPRGDEKARMNLWLLGGQPPAGQTPVEIVVEHFSFEPLASP
jgi:hypothetical protein